MEMQHAFFVMLPMVITIMILGHDPLSIVLYIVVHGTHNQKEDQQQNQQKRSYSVGLQEWLLLHYYNSSSMIPFLKLKKKAVGDEDNAAA